LGCVALALALIARPAAAQYGVWRADSLLAAGRLNAAESLYYAAVRAQPRDPVARGALGKYLAGRGATIAGAVLLEEARDFGGDSAAIARSLAPLYARMNAFEKLEALRPSVVSAAERQRAAWLATHPPGASFGDSVVLLSYRPSGNGDGIGTVLLNFGRAQVPAIIDPRVTGLLLPASMHADVRTFGMTGDSAIAVATAVRIGPVSLANVPAMVADVRALRIGFDVIARYSPSFDPVRGSLVLRKTVVRAAAPMSSPARVPALYDTNGLRLLIGGRWQPTSGAIASMLLATRSWLWDARRGDVVLLRQ
jgi:hypothetical protein